MEEDKSSLEMKGDKSLDGESSDPFADDLVMQ